MNSITNEIVAIKTEVREKNWEEMSLACRQSGLSVKEWCRQNGINASTYYARLRKLRENVCRHLESIEPGTPQFPKSEIKISSGEILVTIPSDASAETISTVLMALKSC